MCNRKSGGNWHQQRGRANVCSNKKAAVERDDTRDGSSKARGEVAVAQAWPEEASAGAGVCVRDSEAGQVFVHKQSGGDWHGQGEGRGGGRREGGREGMGRDYGKGGVRGGLGGVRQAGSGQRPCGNKQNVFLAGNQYYTICTA